MTHSRSVTILCSYVTLGTYIPALILFHKLKASGFECELVALEQLFSSTKLEEIPKLKKAIHANFKFAKTALKMASKNNTSSFDEDKVETLFNRWREQNKNHFVIFTGFWNDAINQFLKTTPDHQQVQVDLVHMDAVFSPSWKSYEPSYGNIRLIKLFDDVEKKLLCYIPPHDNTVEKREGDWVLLHGGGWGIGTYREKISEMIQHKLKLNVVAYEGAEVDAEQESIQYHLLDPEWTPVNEERFSFPPIHKVGSEKTKDNTGGYYPYYNLVLNSRVIMSKPGGGTLNDSISSGVPVVFLESFGEHESHNANLWKSLGFGIDYDDWKRKDFSFDVIQELENNLKAHKTDLKTIYQYYYGTN